MAIPQLKQETFFLIAWILMAISVFGNLWSMTVSWGVINTGAKISTVSGIFFNILLTALFLSMWIGQRKMEIRDNPELDNFLKELEKGGKNEKQRRRL